MEGNSQIWGVLGILPLCGRAKRSFRKYLLTCYRASLFVLGQTVKRYKRIYRDSPGKKLIHRVPHVETLKVIGTVKDQSATKDFLLTFHSNHSPISYRFRDKQRFRSRIANFPHPRVISCPSEGSRLNFVTALELKRTRMIGLPSRGKVI